MDRLSKVTHLHTGSVGPVKPWRMASHLHDFHELIVPLQGTLHVAANGEVRRFGRGTVVLYPAGVAHEEWADPDSVFESGFTSFSGPPFSTAGVLGADDPDGRIRQLVRWLLADRHALRRRAPETADLIVTLALNFFETADHRPEDARVGAVRDYIRRHMTEPIALGDLARCIGVSRFHFAREYRRLTGRTPMADVRRLRADYARDLIMTTDMPLKAVAPAAGLGNEYMLSRLFRRLYGRPPGDLRRR